MTFQIPQTDAVKGFISYIQKLRASNVQMKSAFYNFDFRYGIPMDSKTTKYQWEPLHQAENLRSLSIGKTSKDCNERNETYDDILLTRLPSRKESYEFEQEVREDNVSSKDETRSNCTNEQHEDYPHNNQLPKE